jgi:hypothetical protein
MAKLRYAPQQSSAQARLLDLLAWLFLGVLLSLSVYGFRNFSVISGDAAAGFGPWSLLVLPVVSVLIAAALWWAQRSSWPINLPFDIPARNHATAQKEVGLLLRLLHLWMQLLFCAIQLLTVYQAPPVMLALLLMTVVITDLVLLLYFMMRLSRLAEAGEG